MTYEEAYVSVCKGYKQGRPIGELIDTYIYKLDSEEQYPSLNFYMWLIWACDKSHDDDSNPILILCMAEYIKREEYTKVRYEVRLNEVAASAYSVIDTINMFSMDGNNPPTNIIGAAIRYLFNQEDIDTITSGAIVPWEMSCVSQLPDCGVEYFSRKELLDLLNSPPDFNVKGQIPF